MTTENIKTETPWTDDKENAGTAYDRAGQPYEMLPYVRAEACRTYERRMRAALHDARDQVVREGVTYRASGETPWQVCRSIAGRTNQLDIVVGGRVWRTTGERSVRRILTAED